MAEIAKKYRAVDLFCCAGGATKGLQNAGFHVVGVDVEPQPNYCGDEFIQTDALTFDLTGFDFIWASPPCQAYSISTNNGHHKDAPKLVEKVREKLIEAGVPYIIENVVGAPLVNAVLLCGAAFGLGVSGFDLSRHRIFESSIFLFVPDCTHRRGKTVGVYGGGTNTWHLKKFGRCVTVAELKTAMGIDWMTRPELTQAIPPAYSEFLGRQILAVLKHRLENTDAVDTFPPPARSVAVSK